MASLDLTNTTRRCWWHHSYSKHTWFNIWERKSLFDPPSNTIWIQHQLVSTTASYTAAKIIPLQIQIHHKYNTNAQQIQYKYNTNTIWIQHQLVSTTASYTCLNYTSTDTLHAMSHCTLYNCEVARIMEKPECSLLIQVLASPGIEEHLKHFYSSSRWEVNSVLWEAITSGERKWGTNIIQIHHKYNINTTEILLQTQVKIVLK